LKKTCCHSHLLSDLEIFFLFPKKYEKIHGDILPAMHTALGAAKEEFEKAVTFLKKEFAGLQTGRANPALIEDIEIDAYGQRTPIKHLANISVNGQEIMIDPWDKSQLSQVEKAIRDNSELGLNPVNTGAAIRINVPPLTEERRKEIAKIVHAKAENARVAIRKARHTAHDSIKKEEKDGEMSEDDLARNEKELQKEVDAFNSKIEDLAKHKEAEVMKI
jgi:ribosome recycling factor